MLQSNQPYVFWFDTTAGADLSTSAGLCVIRSGDTVVLPTASTDAAARRTRSYVLARGEISGRQCAVQDRGIAEVIVGEAVTAGQKAIVKASNGRVIPLDPATLVPGDHVLGEFVTTQATTAGRAYVDLDKGFVFEGTSNTRRGNVLAPAALAADRTLTVAEIIENSLIILDPGGAGRTLTTPTAALIVAAGLGVGDCIETVIENSADAAETLTWSAGTGVTIDTASPNLAQNKNALVRFVVTSATSGSEAVRAYVYVS